MHIKSLKFKLSLIGVTLVPELCYFCCLIFICVGCNNKKNIHIWFPGLSVASISQYLLVVYKLLF